MVNDMDNSMNHDITGEQVSGLYDTLARQAAELIREESWHISMFANVSALLYGALANVNWAGFYIVRDGRLLLGPFQGKIACIHIEKGRGVCGTAWEKDETMLVPDVHQFPGHIACDSASRSEIVIPVHRAGEVVAVLDIDSPVKGRFNREDQKGLEQIVRQIENGLE